MTRPVPTHTQLGTASVLENIPDSEHTQGGICWVCSDAYGLWISHPDPQEDR